MRATSTTGISRRGNPYSQYVKLPDDDTLVAMWIANGKQYNRVAALIGCSPSAVGLRLRKLGYRAERQAHVRTRVAELEFRTERLLEAVAALVERVEVLEARPIVRFLEVDHRRIADGGVGGRRSRREAKRAG